MTVPDTILDRLKCNACHHHFDTPIPTGTVVIDGTALDSNDTPLISIPCPKCGAPRSCNSIDP